MFPLKVAHQVYAGIRNRKTASEQNMDLSDCIEKQGCDCQAPNIEHWPNSLVQCF